MSDPTFDEIQNRCKALRKEIRQGLDAAGVPPDSSPYVTSYDIDGDRMNYGRFTSGPYTGVLRVKVRSSGKTKQFMTNSQGKLKDVSRVVRFLAACYEGRKAAELRRKQEEAREEEAAPAAERLREEFHVSEYSGDFRVFADGDGLNVKIETQGTPDQIRDLLTYAWKIGLFKPEGQEEGDIPGQPTVYDRLNEEAEHP